ncbi:MAG: SHOCT domain-containing protein, partial [Anaerolineae bacterium]|nr:SHOCT domain-containing protein [Anaerolineae bacterium]
QLESFEHTPAEIAAASEAQTPAVMLAQLDSLRRQGILTEAEFAEKKAQILARM